MKCEQLVFNPQDREGIKRIMADFGDSEFPFFGTNESGEDVMISVAEDSIVVTTWQQNGWTRENWYELIDGDIVVSEKYGERWK